MVVLLLFVFFKDVLRYQLRESCFYSGGVCLVDNHDHPEPGTYRDCLGWSERIVVVCWFVVWTDVSIVSKLRFTIPSWIDGIFHRIRNQAQLLLNRGFLRLQNWRFKDGHGKQI